MSETVSCGCDPERRNMGVMDITQKKFFTDDERFADFVNAVYFGGRRVVKPEELKDVPETARKADEEAVFERTCDVIKKCTKDGAVFAVYVMENQKTVDYRMPVRVMLEESLRYDSQTKQIAKKNREQRKNTECEEPVNDGEFLYNFRKKDRLTPIYTMVVYWGEDEWDGATSLRELVEVPMEDEQLREVMLEMLPDYKIRVYDLNKEKDFSAFQTNLRTVFEFYAQHNNGKAMKEYMEAHREEVEVLDKESRFFLSKMLKAKNLEKLLKSREQKKEKKEETSMCKAIDELIEEGKQKGIEQGRAEAERNAEKIIHALQQEIENLKRQLTPKIQ